jgi:hypothetical protein
MKQNDMLLLIGGAVVLYLLAKNSTGLSAAQAAINSANLTAMNTVANTNAIASGVTGISNDIGDIFG